MSEPPVLDYRTPPKRPPKNPRQFFAGLIGGTVASALIWIPTWSLTQGTLILVLACAVPVVKLILGIWLVYKPEKRSIGTGILVSIPLGFLIFFGMCAAHL